MIYKRKVDGTAEAKIVPWEQRDLEKDQVLGDGPSFSLDSMRLLFSLAADHQ